MQDEKTQTNAWSVPCTCHKGIRRNGGITPLILNVRPTWKWSGSYPGRFTTEESVPCALRTERWVKSRVDLDTLEKKNLLSMSGIEMWRVKVKYTLYELHVTEQDQLSRSHIRFWAPRPLCRPKFLLVCLNPGAHKSWMPGQDNKLFKMAPNIFIVVNAVLSLI
jgi:hypothetical protein